jgi:uncharacterized membrane protein YhaH (DUF805 family)
LIGLPFWDEWFSHSVRRNRMSFLLANVTLTGLIFLIIVVIPWFSRSRAGFVVVVMFWIPYVICQYFLTAQRLRDIGVTGWLALLWIPVFLIPPPLRLPLTLGFVVVLCFVPGTRGRNRYGDDPLET